MKPESNDETLLWDMLRASDESRVFRRGFTFADIEHK